MKKIDWLLNLMIVVAAVLLVLSIASLAGKIMRSRAEDEEVREIIAEAQARIDDYYASKPAQERPAAATEEPVPVVTAEPETVEDWYIAALPLSKEMQKVAFDAAADNGVDYLLVLAVMQVESNFDSGAVNPVTSCYGLMQLNPSYNPSGLSPEENIRAGTVFLGKLLEEYRGNEAAALRAYNRGFDDGDRAYSARVLTTREAIMRMMGVTFP